MSIFEEVEIRELERIRRKFKEEFAGKGAKLTYLAFVVKATAMALKQFKSLNAEMDMEKGVMIYKKFEVFN
jgi:pyruvate dehydrogenase E2 component (dihydrolipoamide acetyltransferase)